MFGTQGKKSRSIATWAGATVLAAGVWGCDVEPTEVMPDPEAPAAAVHKLQQMDSCDAFLAYAKEAALEKMTATAQNRYEEACNWSDGDIVLDSDGGTERPGSVDGDVDSDVDADADADADGDVTIGVDGDDANGDKGNDGNAGIDTNVQEKGVDEGDIVKSDGEYFYVLSGRSLVVVDSTNAEALAETGRLDLQGQAEELILYDNLAAAFLRVDASQVDPALLIQGSGYPGGYPDDVAVDAYYYDPYDYGAYTRILLIDLSDKSAPSILRQVDYAGEYITARRVGNSLRAVVSTTLPGLNLSTYLDPWAFCGLPGGEQVYQAALEQLMTELQSSVEAVTLDEILPKKMDSVEGEAEFVAECSDVYGPSTPAGNGILTVVTLNLDEPTAKQKDVAAFGDRGLVYASTDSLYLSTSPEYVDWAWRSGEWESPTTGIHKFDIATDSGTAIYKATGAVKGRMLNQFCMGEKDGYLRVATTEGGWDFETWDNRITVLKETDGELVQTGTVAGFGEKEEIYGARFLGDKGYVVTFRNTDPLFTFDLSDPENPVQVGMWEGPGYSSYLHPFGEDYLLAVGMESGMTAVSLYDLRDFSTPAMVERIYMTNPEVGEADFSEGYMYSPAVDDHKAFRFIPDGDEGLMILPYEGYAYLESREWGWTEIFATGLALFNVTNEGFEATGAMNALPAETGNDKYLWEAVISRSAVIDDVLYGISPCRVSSADLTDPETLLDTLALYPENTDCGSYIWGYGGDGDTDADMDTDVDSDADGDMDADADADADGDMDADTDSDTDAPEDRDSEGETGADGDADADTEMGGDIDSEAPADTAPRDTGVAG